MAPTWGLVYSGLRGNFVDASMYGAGVLIAVVPGGALRIMRRGAASAEDVIAHGGRFYRQAGDQLIEVSFEKADLITTFKFKNPDALSDDLVSSFFEALKENKVSDDLMALIRNTADDNEKLRLLANNVPLGIISLDEYVKIILRKDIRSAIINSSESKGVALKYFNKIKESPNDFVESYTRNLDNFEKWYEDVFKSNLFEAHHIIPKQVLDGNANLQKILDWARKNNMNWDFGGLDNGVMLQKRKKNITGEIVGDHANHPNYNTVINDKITNDIFDANDLEGSFNELLIFVNDLKRDINIEVIEGNRIINDLKIQ